MRGSTGPLAWAFRTLVGGARRWVRFPLTAPSTSESTRHETGDREEAPADRNAISVGRDRPSADAEVTSTDHETASANREGAPNGPGKPSADREEVPAACSPAGESENRTDEGDAPGDSADEMDPDERILAALVDNGGKLAQRDVPAVADLSQSAASRRLIAMEERGEVVRYEIGRGKTVFLPGEEPSAFQSSIDGGDPDPATTP